MLHTLALLILLFNVEMDPKMRLDLSISENILTELLRQNGASATMVKGSHIPGYGVMMELSYRHLSIRALGTQVAGVDIEALIKRYLNDYGDLISGLGPDEQLSVSFTSRVTSKRTILSVKKRDVADRRSGKLTEDVFMSRIRSQEMSSSPDVDIFAKVMETVVNADTSKAFTLRNVTASGLPGYGMLVSGTLRSGSFPVAYSLNSDRYAPTAIEYTIDEMAVPEIEIPSLDSLRILQSREFTESLEAIRVEATAMRDNLNRIHVMRRQSAADVKAAFDALESNLKRAILDYGRTLNSLPAGQTLLIRITNERPSEHLPNSITFTVPKQVLADYDRRAITQEQAMSRIIVSKE
jgi:hypothetical protein